MKIINCMTYHVSFVFRCVASVVLWLPFVADADITFLPVVSSSIFLLFFFLHLISAVAEWMSTTLLHIV